jgi:hypothetical protein
MRTAAAQLVDTFMLGMASGIILTIAMMMGR